MLDSLVGEGRNLFTRHFQHHPDACTLPAEVHESLQVFWGVRSRQHHVSLMAVAGFQSFSDNLISGPVITAYDLLRDLFWALVWQQALGRLYQ